MTPEQVIDYQADQELTKLKQNIEDQTEADMIESVEEFNYYMEYGKTYEDELSDILTTKKSLSGWKTAIPDLKQQVSRLEEQVRKESAKSANWFPWDKPNTGKIGDWENQLNALKEIIADVEAGKDPIYDIEKYK